MSAPPTDADLLPVLTALGGTVLMVGDLMLDVYVYGTAVRISPEAPVPVMRSLREDRMLGGVGNVARNVAALGARTILIAPIGTDGPASSIEALIAGEPRIEGRLIPCTGRRTTVKRRFVAAGQQMLRVDEEDIEPLADDEEATMVAKVLAALPVADILVLSDYGKGALTPLVVRRTIEAARAAGKIVLVDPKHGDMARYAGASCITPNAGELALATGGPTETDDAVVAGARRVIDVAGADHVLVTRSEKGMSLVSREGAPVHLRARKREVFDVSGAGDTVIATLAVSLAGRVAWPIAAGLANTAAGEVVGKQGTATCSLDDLALVLADGALGLNAKLQGLPRAASLVAQWRAGGLRVGFTNGCFDLLHPGHVSLLQAARDGCDRLVVGLNSDASVSRLKGPTRPLQVEAARAAVLSAFASVDLVVLFDEDTPIDMIRTLRPSVLFKGADYTLDQVVGADLVIADGGEVRLIDIVEGQSTTSLLARIREASATGEAGR